MDAPEERQEHQNRAGDTEPPQRPLDGLHLGHPHGGRLGNSEDPVGALVHRYHQGGTRGEGREEHQRQGRPQGVAARRAVGGAPLPSHPTMPALSSEFMTSAAPVAASPSQSPWWSGLRASVSEVKSVQLRRRVDRSRGAERAAGGAAWRIDGAYHHLVEAAVQHEVGKRGDCGRSDERRTAHQRQQQKVDIDLRGERARRRRTRPAGRTRSARIVRSSRRRRRTSGRPGARPGPARRE